MSHYHQLIHHATGETKPNILQAIEDIMRFDIYGGTLDSQSRKELEKAARVANAIRIATSAATKRMMRAAQ